MVRPCIRSLPKRSALIVSNWRSNIISRIRFDGDCKHILISSKKIGAFCIVSDPNTDNFWLAVLFRLEALDTEFRLNLFACDEDGNIDLSQTKSCFPNIEPMRRITNIDDIQQFSDHCLIFAADFITHFIDYSNPRKIRHYSLTESDMHINCLLADKKLLGEHIILGSSEFLYIYKIEFQNDLIRMKSVYEISLFPRVPMNIFRLNLSAKLLLVTAYESKNQSTLTFALLEILQDAKRKRLYLQEAIDIAIDPGNTVALNLARIQPHIVIHANSNDSLVSIDQTGQLISGTILMKVRSRSN